MRRAAPIIFPLPLEKRVDKCHRCSKMIKITVELFLGEVPMLNLPFVIVI